VSEDNSQQALVKPDESELLLFQLPAAPAPEKDPRAVENRAGVEDLELPDGKIIKLNFGFRKNGEKVYEVGGKKFTKERVLRLYRQLGKALADVFAPAEPSQPRSKNKLASSPESKVAGSPEPRIINPKTMLRVKGGDDGWEFATVPKFLNGLVTHAEQLVYGWMIFRADQDGVFRRSLHSLARDAGLSITGTRKAVASLLARPLILKRTARNGAANEYLFLWCPEMEKGPETSAQCALVLGDVDSETSAQCALQPVLSVAQTSAHCAPLNNKEEKKESSSSSAAEPSIDWDEIAAAAAEAADSPDHLIARLQPFFPQLDMAEEWRRYVAGGKEINKPAIAVSDNPKIFTFVKWLQQAGTPVPQPKQQEGSPTHDRKDGKPNSTARGITAAAERRAAERAREFPTEFRPRANE